MRPAHYKTWGQRGKLKIPAPPKGFCRWCGDAIPKGSKRYAYCSAECRNEVWLRISWPTLREHIIERDVVCRLCDGASYRCAYSFVVSHDWQTGLDYCRVDPDWNVDHIKPVAEGGTDDPANLRLLCGRCHKRVTKDWHGRRTVHHREVPHTNQLPLGMSP